MNVGKMLNCWGYIFTLVSGTFTQVQIIFSFRRTAAPNLFMLSLCLAYRVNILFKCIWGLGGWETSKDNNFVIILNVVIMLNCWTHITVISACNMVQLQTTFSFLAPLQASSFLHYGLAYTVYLLLKCIWGLRKFNIFHSYECRYGSDTPFYPTLKNLSVDNLP